MRLRISSPSWYNFFLSKRKFPAVLSGRIFLNEPLVSGQAKVLIPDISPQIPPYPSGRGRLIGLS
jgi:hypothetical protein